jgi:hypothetical protein
MHEEGVTNKLPNDVGTTQARRVDGVGLIGRQASNMRVGRKTY